MRWSYFRGGSAPPIAPIEPDNNRKDELEWAKLFFESIRKAGGTYPNLNKDLASDQFLEWAKYFKDIGFNLALKDDADLKEQLGEKLDELGQQSLTDIADLVGVIEQYSKPYKEEIDNYKGIIDSLNLQLGQLDKDNNQRLKEIEAWITRKEDAYRERDKIDEEIAAAKKDLLTKWIKEGTQLVKDVLKANEEVLKEKQRIAKDAYEQNKQQNEELVNKLTKERNRLDNELQAVKEREAATASEGNSMKSNRYLVKTGYLVAVGIGMLFSIFTYNAAFSSDDIASFIITGLLDRASRMIYNDFSRIFQFLGVLGIVAFTSILCRSAIIHIRKRQLRDLKNEDTDFHEMGFKLKSDNFIYNGRFKSNNWPLFWLKITPLLLFAGIIAIFISSKSTDGLTNSMGGAVMGSLFSLCVAAFIYVYNVRVIEPRLLKAYLKNVNNNSNPYVSWKWVRQWELIVSIVFFIVITLFVAVYTAQSAPENNKLPPGIDRLISLLWFISISVLNGFVIALGARYQCLRDREAELSARIFAYDNIIDRYKGVVRTDVNQPLNQQADVFFRKLADQVHRKNNVIFKNGVAMHIFSSHASKSFSMQPPPSRAARLSSWFDRRWQTFSEWLENLFLPSEIEEPVPGYSHTHKHISVPVPWEEEFYPELYHRWDMKDNEIGRCDEEINKLKAEQANRGNIKTGHYATLLNSLNEMRARQNKCNQMILEAMNAVRQGAADIKLNAKVAQELMIQGFELGLWYKRIDPEI